MINFPTWFHVGLISQLQDKIWQIIDSFPKEGCVLLCQHDPGPETTRLIPIPDLEAPYPTGLQVIPKPSNSVNNEGIPKPGLVLNYVWENRHLWATPVLPACGIISPKHVEAQPAVTCPLTAVGQRNTCGTSQLWARGARLEGANKPCHIPHPSPSMGPHLAVPDVFLLFHGRPAPGHKPGEEPRYGRSLLAAVMSPHQGTRSSANPNPDWSWAFP